MPYKVKQEHPRPRQHPRPNFTNQGESRWQVAGATLRQNVFIPLGLPLISDPLLIQTLIEYRQCYQMLQQSDLSDSSDMGEQVQEALHVVESELLARGIDPGTIAHDLSLQA